MALQITAWEDLAFFYEEVDEAGEFQYATFAVVDEDDTAYFGKLNHPKHSITFEQLTSALTPIPDEGIFPEWAPSSVILTRAQDTLPANTYVKHPNLYEYDVLEKSSVVNLLSKDLLEEAKVMEILSQYPHPNIIHYYGCRVRRNRITGLVLDRHPISLIDYVMDKVGPVHKEPFMQALESAIYHLHSLGWAHNDVNPGSVLVNKEGMPVLIDFASAREIGAKLGSRRGTKGWIDGKLKDYNTSEKAHDIFGLEKIRTWLDAPTIDDLLES